MDNYLNKQGLTTVASFVNKKLTQYTEMPEAAAAFLDTIVQYTGTTNVSYTNGHFYKCVYNGAHYWVELTVDNLDSYQTSILASPITIGESEATTVEDALNNLNTKKVNIEANKSLMTSDERIKLASIASGAEVNVQADWSQTTLSADDYIKNKPTLGTASEKDVPASGNASSAEVVMGNDTRLTDARNAADVSAWAKAATKPSYTANEVGAVATSLVGSANGVASLDASGKILSSQLPSFVDAVVEGYLDGDTFYDDEEETQAITPSSGKIYVDLIEDKTYRWGGNMYVEISESIALGETDSTAYRGDRGKIAYNDSQTNKTNIGTLSNLNTTTKTNLVAAINEVRTTANGKQNALTFDSTPTSGSSNPVTSGGVYTAINTAISNGVDNLLNTSY